MHPCGVKNEIEQCKGRPCGNKFICGFEDQERRKKREKDFANWKEIKANLQEDKEARIKEMRQNPAAYAHIDAEKRAAAEKKEQKVI